MVKPSYGICVGRFQVHVLTRAHFELLEKVASRHPRVIVFVGVSPVRGSKRNPLDFETRKVMIQGVFPGFTVLPLQDCLSDEHWSRTLDDRIREVVSPNAEVTLYGGRDCFKAHYSGQHEVIELALDCHAGNHSGENVRKILANAVVANLDFRAGVIYAAMNRHPHVVTTVDVVIYQHNNGTNYELLLGKKPDEPKWRFIGGHAEVGTEDFEQDVRNEAMEEAGVDLGRLEYVGSTKVDDWRYKQEEDKIKTIIYAGEASSGMAKPGSDIAEVKWFKLDEIEQRLFVSAHVGLWPIVAEYFSQLND